MRRDATYTNNIFLHWECQTRNVRLASNTNLINGQPQHPRPQRIGPVSLINPGEPRTMSGRMPRELAETRGNSSQDPGEVRCCACDCVPLAFVRVSNRPWRPEAGFRSLTHPAAVIRLFRPEVTDPTAIYLRCAVLSSAGVFNLWPSLDRGIQGLTLFQYWAILQPDSGEAPQAYPSCYCRKLLDPRGPS